MKITTAKEVVLTDKAKQVFMSVVMGFYSAFSEL
jgi:hypothetical protein